MRFTHFLGQYHLNFTVMKKIMLVFIAFSFFVNLSAQIRVDSDGKVGIGTTTPSYRLDVVGNTRVTGDIYLGSTSNLISTTNDTALVFKVGNAMVGFTGASVGDNRHRNVAFGYGSLTNFNTSSMYNVAFGWQTLYNNTGWNNAAVGYQALYANTSGGYNTATGTKALYQNTTGFCNTAIGYEALCNNTTSWRNTAVGYRALHANTTGGGDPTGGCNTAIGYYASTDSPGLSNTTAIGYQATTTANNQVRIGNSNVTSIGGYAAWSNISDGRIKRNIQANVPGLDFINLLQPITYNLDLDALDDLLGIELDDNQEDMPLTQEQIDLERKARKAKEEQVQSGFIAQDVEKAALELGYNFSGVDAPQNDKDVYSLRYAEFVVPLVKAVQELSAQKDAAIASLQEQINELKGSGSSLRVVADRMEETGIITPDVVTQCRLYQNNPNPFSHSTQIKYYLPEEIGSAYLYIYDMQGKQLKQITITDRGAGQQTISGSELPAGIYLYALLADGKEVDVKRMILTE